MAADDWILAAVELGLTTETGVGIEWFDGDVVGVVVVVTPLDGGLWTDVDNRLDPVGKAPVTGVNCGSELRPFLASGKTSSSCECNKVKTTENLRKEFPQAASQFQL